MISVNKWLLPVVLLNIGFSSAQIHNNAWFRGTLDFTLCPKWKLDAEFQHRRQNGSDNRNLFSENLQFAFRNWIHYEYQDNLKFSVSPVGIFSNYRVIEKSTDESADPVCEIRFSAASEWKKLLQKKTSFNYRTALEYRVIRRSPQDVLRLRNRVGISRTIFPNTKVTMFDEVFLQITGFSNGHFFEQNRLGVDMEWRVSPEIKLNLGYILSLRQFAPNSGKVIENNFFLNFLIQFKEYRTGRSTPFTGISNTSAVFS